MVDLSKHVARAKQALERRNYDLSIEVCGECIDVAPADLDIHRILLDAARRKAKEAPRKSLFGVSMGSMNLSMSKDPHKYFVASAKRLAGGPDNKSLIDIADAANRLSATVKPMREVAIFYYEEMKRSGMFSDKVLWNLGQVYFEKYKETKDEANLDKALVTMRELEAALPNHVDAPKLVKNWEALKSMNNRNKGGASGDFRSQLNSDTGARRAEVMNRIIRTIEDAQEVLKYVEQDLATNPSDKALMIKKGDILKRIGRNDEARAAFEQAQVLDAHDFTVSMRLGDLRLEDAKLQLDAGTAGGGDATALKRTYYGAAVDEYRKRAERQPTDMGHKFSLGVSLLQLGQIEAAAGEFQRTVNDPKYRRTSHKYLGYCFARKNLLDLAAQNYNAFLSLVEDELGDEAKEVRYALARVFEDQGRKDDAIKQFEKLVSLDLGYKDAADRLGKLRGI